MTKFLTGRSILVVEDEMLILKSIEMTLEELGCTAIFAAASVATALALLDIERFDAAMVDVNLGGEKSYPIAKALAQRGIPFAFSTGYGDRVDFDGRPMLRKPYVRGTLVTVLKQLVANEPSPAAA